MQHFSAWIRGRRYTWKPLTKLRAAHACATVESVDWIERASLTDAPLGVILPENEGPFLESLPDIVPPRYAHFRRGCDPGCWWVCTGMDPDEVVRLRCPECGMVQFLQSSAFTVSADGVVERPVKCCRCAWFHEIQLDGWKG